MSILDKFFPPSTEKLIKRLKDERKYYEAQHALVDRGEAVVEPVIAVLNDLNNNSKVRGRAAWILGRIADARAVESLIAALKDEVVWSAYALGEIGDKRAVEPLLETLKSSNTYRQKEAKSALGKIGDKRAFEPIARSTRSPEPGERESAARALGRIGDARAIPYLEVLLFAETYGLVRRAAAEALGQIGGSEAVEPLVEALNDSYIGVRETAALALEQMGDIDSLKKDHPATGKYRVQYNKTRAIRAAIDWWRSPESRLFWDGRVPRPGDGANCDSCGQPIRPMQGFLCMPQKLVCEQCFDSKGFVAYEPQSYDEIGSFKFASSLRMA